MRFKNHVDKLVWGYMQDTFARARTRPKGRKAKRARATIGYLVYNVRGNIVDQ